MREKTKKHLITFHNTVGALEMEEYCMREGLPGRLIPVPPAISAGCGMAWCVPDKDWDRMEGAAQLWKEQIENIYELWL